MKKHPINRSKPSAFDALTSMAIIAANSPIAQQTMPVIALALVYVAGVIL